MIPVFQTKQHDPPRQNGNCFRACIASIFEIDIDSIPLFEDMQEEWWQSIRDWAKSMGYRLELRQFRSKDKNADGCTLRLDIEYLDKDMKGLPKGWSILTGRSPRYDTDHCVVAFDGLPYFDPQSHLFKADPMVMDVLDYIWFLPMEVA